MLEVENDVTTEMEASPSVEAVTTETPAVTPEPQSSIDPSMQVTAPVTPEVPSYAPNFKYSVRGQEKEIGEKYRALIKDAESEKEIKELFEKAEGIDFVKGDRDNLKKEYHGFKEQVVPHLEVLHKFTTMRDQGNLGAAFKVAGITDEQLFEHCIKLLEIQGNPTQAQLYQSHTEASLKQIEIESRLSKYEQQETLQQTQQFEQSLDNAINGQKDLVTQVEQRLGKTGAFKDEVVALGMLEYNRGNVMTVDQAVEAVASRYRPFITTSQLPATQAGPQAHKAPAVIPSVGSSNASVISTRPKSTEDLRKLAREL